MAKTDSKICPPRTQGQAADTPRPGIASQLSPETRDMLRANMEAVVSYMKDSAKQSADGQLNEPRAYSIKTSNLYCNIQIGRLCANEAAARPNGDDRRELIKREEPYAVVNLSKPMERSSKRRRVTDLDHRKDDNARTDGSSTDREWAKSSMAKARCSERSDYASCPHSGMSFQGESDWGERSCSRFGGKDEEQKTTREPKCVAINVRVGDLDRLWPDLLEPIQQKGLKRVIQYWIEQAHPQKQSNFPYNGGSAAHELDGYEKCNPGRGKAPPYWPEQNGWLNMDGTACRHREPHHLKKAERLCLAPHLLRIGSGPKAFPFDFSVDNLEKATDRITVKHKDEFPPGADKYLQAIYEARRQYARYEADEIDYDSEVHVYVSTSKRSKVVNHMTSRDSSSPDNHQIRDANNSDTDLQQLPGLSFSTNSSFHSEPSESDDGAGKFNLNLLHETVEDRSHAESVGTSSSSSNLHESPMDAHGLHTACTVPEAEGSSNHRQFSCTKRAAQQKQSQSSLNIRSKPSSSTRQSSSNTFAIRTKQENDAVWPLCQRDMKSSQATSKGVEATAGSLLSDRGHPSGFQGFTGFSNDFLLRPGWYPTKYDIGPEFGGFAYTSDVYPNPSASSPAEVTLSDYKPSLDDMDYGTYSGLNGSTMTNCSYDAGLYSSAASFPSCL